MYNTKSEPQGKRWILGDEDVSMQVHPWLKKKGTILVSNVDNGGGYACLGAGDIWKISVPSSQFCCKPKTAPKKNDFKKNLPTRIPYPEKI